MDTPTPSNRNPWSWIPSLYFTQAIPNGVVASLSVTMYKNLGISNTSAAFYTSLLYLPWVIKPLWAPFIELRGTKRRWVVVLQYLMSAALCLVALSVPAPFFFQATLAVFWMIALGSATHDIAADGFYLLALEKPQQAAFVGVRSTFYRLAGIVGGGIPIILVGRLANITGDMARAWAIVFAILAGCFFIAAWLHSRVMPKLAVDVPSSVTTNPWNGWWTVFSAFFRKPGIMSVLGFLLLFRIAEAQLLKLVIPFMLDGRDVGGLGLSNEQLGVFYTTIGPIALTIGGLLGGWLVSQYGLRKFLWWMVAAMHVPNAVFVVLAMIQPENLGVIGGAVMVEQLGYGFGFTAYMVYMMMVAADGPHKTAHYAICTGFMALGIMLPGMFSGWIQELLGYQNFFIWVVACAVPSIAACAFIKIDEGFGRKTDGASE